MPDKMCHSQLEFLFYFYTYQWIKQIKEKLKEIMLQAGLKGKDIFKGPHEKKNTYITTSNTQQKHLP